MKSNPSNNKLSVSNQVKKSSEDALRATDQVGEQLNELVAKRWGNFKKVRTFAFGWVLFLFVLGAGVLFQTNSLRALYLDRVPDDGGVYVEGVVGDASTFNPLFSSSATDEAVGRLLFKGLLQYDDQNKLVGDLAESFSVNDDNTVYTVKLKQDIMWSDGTPITAADVLFTVDSIQHPDTRSTFNSSWQGVTAQAKDDKTVTFSLTNVFVPFPNSLTVGLLPSHILGEVEPLQLRTHPFNLSPTVNSGPFKFTSLTLGSAASQIDMERNDSYYGQQSRVDKMIIRSFKDYETMIEAYNNDELSAIAGVRINDLNQVENINDQQVNKLQLLNSVFVFMNFSDADLKRPVIRKALLRGTDQAEIFNKLDQNYPLTFGPLLPSQLGYDANLVQLEYDFDEAVQLLDKDGWKVGDDGYRVKGDKTLEFSMVSQETEEYRRVANELQRQWKKLGVRLKVDLANPRDLQQRYLTPHNYELALINISLGIDSDVFVYWHSSQASVGGFNFSEYENPIIDANLEAGRTRSDAELRKVKYEAFLEQWRRDAPAISLYQPGYTYIQKPNLSGLVTKPMVSPLDRFYQVENWTVNTTTSTKSE